MSSGGDSPPTAPALRGPLLHPPGLQPCCSSLPRATLMGRTGSSPHPTDSIHGTTSRSATCKAQSPTLGPLPSRCWEPPGAGRQQPLALGGAASCQLPGPSRRRCHMALLPQLWPRARLAPGQEGGGHPPAPPGLASDRTRLPTPALPPTAPRLRRPCPAAPGPCSPPAAHGRKRPGLTLHRTLRQRIPNAGIRLH